MARQVRCKICKNQGDTDIFYKVTSNGKNSYYCNKDEYEKYEKKKSDYTLLMRYIALDVLNYEDGQIVPPSMVKKINTLHGFYDYEVILETFKENKDTIQYWIKTKDFSSEYGMVSYVMKIIEGNINDVFKSWKYKKQQEIKRENKKDTLAVDLDIIQQAYQNKPNSDNGILSFLDEEDM